jgi:alcohol dehydrogenase, propanol-preferring
MRAMVLERPGTQLRMDDLPIPQPQAGQLLIKVTACGVCRTDLHVIDGELPSPKLPLIPGHQIVGTIAKLGEGVAGYRVGERVGVAWLGSACGHCSYCLAGRENLCDQARYTGYQLDGGFANYCVANAAFTYRLPGSYSDIHVAPLLCAGLIGYRAYRMAGGGKTLGLYGFGSSAHIIAQLARHEGRRLFAFTRPCDTAAQALAMSLGAQWAGGSDEKPPEPLDGAIIFATDGSLVPQALHCLSKGATLVCAGIHMSDIPTFPYNWLWEERVIRSVANLTRQDGREFLQLAPQVPIETKVTLFALEEANEALEALRKGKFTGSAVIQL